MQLRFFNTLTHSIEPFEPIAPGWVRFYTCGPTVHDFAHIGNFRAYVFEDLLRRTLRYAGFQVTQVMNLTDVDDKTIRKSAAAGLSLKEYTRRYVEAFFEDLAALGIERAEYYPAATDHIPEMIALIQRLMEKGFAYRSEDGSVYFSIDRFPAYGRLAQLDREGLKPGARVSQDEYEKENVGDFALWKAWSPEDGDVVWDAPWGRGRPGWHIECSAMSMKYLGESFDIHTGGIDNIFPHHEDEIAQSEAATGRPFVRYWLHCAHLMVDGRKMSKSLGNFHTLRDILSGGYSGREARYVLIGAHYRQTLNFTWASLDGARAALRRLDEFVTRMKECAGEAASGALPEWASALSAKYDEALADDLNIPAALAVVFDAVRDGHRAADAGILKPAEAAAIRDLFARWDRVLGILASAEEGIPPDIQELARLRAEARQAKQWAEADRLRDELKKLGWTIQDTPQGPKLRRL